MSDLNYESRHEEKNSPTLSDMPIHILTRVVNELDFGSRMKLQKTCHGFRDFFNSYDSTCEKMSLTFKSEESGLLLEWSIDEFNVQYIERKKKCLVKVEKEKKEKFLSKSHFLEIGLADFKNAIKNPNFKIKNLSVRLEVGSKSTITGSCIDKNGQFRGNKNDYFFDKLSKTLKSLDQKLKVEKLNMHTYTKEKYAISILQYIQPEKLEEICLGYYIKDNWLTWIKSLLNINQLTSLEQWKMAKSLKMINLYSDMPVENISHFDEFAGILTSLSPENIVFLKEVYLQSATFKACYIEIETNYNQMPPQNHINIEAVNNLLGPVDPFDRSHPDVRHYSIPNSNQWLLMKITPTSVHIYKTDSLDSYINPPTLCEHPELHFRLVQGRAPFERRGGIRHQLQVKIKDMN